MTNRKAEAMNATDKALIRDSLFEMNMRDGDHKQAMFYADNSYQMRAALDALDDANAEVEAEALRADDAEEEFERKLDGLKATVRDAVDDLLRTIE